MAATAGALAPTATASGPPLPPLPVGPPGPPGPLAPPERALDRTAQGQRSRCDACQRALEGCWCSCVRPVLNRTGVLVLQHPDEVHEVKNTAALLHRCLAKATLRVGDIFDRPPETEGMVLLYPQTPGDPALQAAAPMPPLAAVKTLVVLDATWRKSRRMLYANPWLAALPRFSLEAPPASRYAIRKARSVDQRSTLEACALALAQLDGGRGDPAAMDPLWQAMEAFVGLQQQLLREGRARRAGACPDPAAAHGHTG